MTEFDLDKLITAAKDPAASKSIDSLTGLLDEGVRVCEKLEKIMGFLEKHGYNSIIKKAVIKKYDLVNVPDLKDEKAIIPASETHMQAFLELNAMTESELKKMIEAHGNKSIPGTDTDK